MHLLAATPGGYSDESQVVITTQDPADWVILTAADTEVLLLSKACKQSGIDHSIRVGHLNNLRNYASIDLYRDDVLQHAKVIVANLLGGSRYWQYLTEQLLGLQARGIEIIFLPGDDTFDEDLVAQSSIERDKAHTLWQYLRFGGLDNTQNFLKFLNHIFNDTPQPKSPKLLAECTLSWHESALDAKDFTKYWNKNYPTVAILYYRSHLMSANLSAITGLSEALAQQGFNPMPIALSSLKNNAVLLAVKALLERFKCNLIIDATAFAVTGLNKQIGEVEPSLFGESNIVIQAILVGSTKESWQQESRGLPPRELAMHIALPEVDGKIIGIPIAFKEVLYFDEALQIDVVGHKSCEDRARDLAKLCWKYHLLQVKENKDKNIALLLANYPISDGRIANGVGLDVPQSLVSILNELKKAGYDLEHNFDDGDAIIAKLHRGATNDSAMLPIRNVDIFYPISEYLIDRSNIPQQLVNAVTERWGQIEDDAYIRNNAFCIAGIALKNVFIGIQPPRGYQIDLDANYHDPDLIPPHYYLAFYCWLRYRFNVDAIIQVGKHGNLEWLPGKSVALGAQCWPDAIMGATPNFYPFIVNDPGEGTQAKRRTHSVVIDHLMPPLVRAENYGELVELERLVDEYYHAQQLDPRRAEIIKKDIIASIKSANLDRDLGLTKNELDADDLNQLDTYLCDLKEAQIRGGLHIIGKEMEPGVLTETLLSLTLLERSDGKGRNQSIIDALSLDFDFEPAKAKFKNPAAPWNDNKPDVLLKLIDDDWRTAGDTLERLKLYALKLIAGDEELPSHFENSSTVLEFIKSDLHKLITACPQLELNSILKGLDGRAIEAGPSGAPSRGRLDILPTGRNFYSVDTRAIPTQSAWRIGFAAAHQFIERYVQDHGEYPTQVAMSVWGTSTMRTGGDDIAQIFALIGARPLWDNSGQRVIDFEILPTSALGRPRVDVTVRISGFFRDAFENVIMLLDAAFNKIAALDEHTDENALKLHNEQRSDALIKKGVEKTLAKEQANYRIFGSKPGAYGAGLQGLIEHRNWQERDDLGRAFLNWSSYAYSQKTRGNIAKEAFSERLKNSKAILHNQDNREHDILDADDYYQFQGGLAAAAASLGNESATLYHGDNHNPENPRVRALSEEINRVMRSRALNPKWISAMQRHGYKGAFEMAATVDYLFAFDATTELVEDWHYKALSDSYLFDNSSRKFLEKHNPHALRDMAERLLEAIQRNMWHNSENYQERLTALIIDCENQLEQNG